MTNDDLIKHSSAEIAKTEKQAAAQSARLSSLHAAEYGSDMQSSTYEGLLDLQLDLSKLRHRHQRIEKSVSAETIQHSQDQPDLPAASVA